MKKNVSSDRKRDSGHKWKLIVSSEHKKIDIFSWRVVIDWHGFPRKVVKSPYLSVERFRVWLDVDLSNLL